MNQILDQIDFSNINDVCTDSRNVSKGSIFIAIKGATTNGAHYIKDAIKSGAKYIVLYGPEPKIEQYSNTTFLYVQDVQSMLGKICNKFYNKKPSKIIAITGTNGKTSICHFLIQICSMLSIPAITIGTLGIKSTNSSLNKAIPQNFSMPDCVTIHKTLSDAKNHGIDFSVCEATSHGLSQGRIEGVKIGVGAFASFSQDHLDYHKTIEDYWNSKETLFTKYMDKGSFAFLHESVFCRLEKKCQDREINPIEYGKNGKDSSYEIINVQQNGYDISINISGEIINGFFPLIGEFQISNFVCALSIIKAYGYDLGEIDISNLKPINGRCEYVGSLNGGDIFIDYAHTPGALKSLLRQIKPHYKGRILVLFGCGGERDGSKRPIMGRIAEKYAQGVIVTDDNPRDENPSAIRKDIMAKCPDAMEIPERGKAISKALNMIGVDDVLLVCGKGHENYQIIGKDKYEFCDKSYIQNIIKMDQSNG